jgi:putative pyruvate formate lyase activating enzyme
MGRTVDEAEFAGICLALQEKHAENINIVTGSHAVPVLVNGIKAAKKQGLAIPVLWNSSGYESLEALSLLEDVIDVYLPDLKTLDPALAGQFFNAPDYGGAASTAIKKMLQFRGTVRFSGDSLCSGVIVRHLVLPEHLEATREVLRWFAENARGRSLLSLMTQYTPVPAANYGGGTPSGILTGTPGSIPAGMPNRYINEAEYETVLGWLDEFGIEDGFYQELVPGSGWLPDFNRTNPFSSELSTPVWHWSTVRVSPWTPRKS